ncbi:MAG TPA: hypothetical protein VE989_05655 [Sphingomicrobium sp.]|jgi:hypothetical protein|nr:hypothetical protein [Sphingomicrobium sp.]
MFEIVIRGEEHESAGHSHGYPDDAPIELDGETLCRHNSSPDERAHARQPHWLAPFANHSSALGLRKSAPL